MHHVWRRLVVYSVSFVTAAARSLPISPCLYQTAASGLGREAHELRRRIRRRDQKRIGKSFSGIQCVFFVHDNRTYAAAQARGWQAVRLHEHVNGDMATSLATSSAINGSRMLLTSSPGLLAVLQPHRVPLLMAADFAMYIEPRVESVGLAAVLKAAQRDLLETPLAFTALNRATHGALPTPCTLH